jgi:hypothetical protein
MEDMYLISQIEHLESLFLRTLMDGMDLRYVLDDLADVDLKKLFAKKISALNYNCQPFYSVITFKEEIKNK